MTRLKAGRRHTAAENGSLEVIRADLQRMNGDQSFVSALRAIRSPSFRHLVYLRFAQQFALPHPAGIAARVLLNASRRAHGFRIPIRTRIGKGLYIGHPGTIVINAAATLGDNCNITHNITIGQTNRGSRQGSPRMGNSVWIGTGAVIVGGIVIGDNVLIAPNAFVNFDVPSDSLVLGNPGVIHQKTPDVVSGYIQNPIGGTTSSSPTN